MPNWCRILTLTVTLATASGAQAADDWSFIAGKYAVSSDDCKFLATGQPFSRTLVDKIESEVLTREGITSQRETHCRFRSSTRETGGTKWIVKSTCEEMGSALPDLESIKITKNPDGSLIVVAENIFDGPLQLKLCRK